MHLTDAETLFIQRRRLDVNQAERATALQIPEWLYVEYEQDKRDVPDHLAAMFGFNDSLTELEKCLLYRKRNGWTQQEVADDIDCSRLWVIKMENGTANPGLLLDYWS